MKALRTLLAAAALWAACAFPALAQTAPGWTYQYVPTVAQWNVVFANKQDYLGAPPLLTTGGTMVGPLVTEPSQSAGAGFNVSPGVAPSAPINGDAWATATGMFYQFSGATLQFWLSPVLAVSSTAPTVSSGFCTSPSISANNGTAAFSLTIGSACGTTTGTLGFPTAAHGWACHFNDLTNPDTNVVSQTGGGAGSVIVKNYSRTTGAPLTFTAADVVNAHCTAY